MLPEDLPIAMESELLPCPFCGEGSAVVVERTPLQFKVFCGNGPCSVSTAIWGARQPAIAAWNRRRAPSEREKWNKESERYCCENCGYVKGRPVENCGHVAGDGTCKHPKNMTPECHDNACPLVPAPSASEREAALEEVAKAAQFVVDWAGWKSCGQNGDGCGTPEHILVNAIAKLAALQHKEG